MPIQVETRDCAALTDADLDEMASMGGAFDIGVLSKAKEDWVLCTTARIDDKLHGCTFSTLERIGGTPCVLRRSDERQAHQQARSGAEGPHGRGVPPGADGLPRRRRRRSVRDSSRVDALEAFKQVDELIPRPGHRAVGEERAWGRRLAKRFGVDATYDEQSFVVKSNGQSGFLDHETLKPEKIKPELAALFATVNPKKGGSLVVHGWVMAEDLLKLGAR